jgi:hypothetical protein
MAHSVGIDLETDSMIVNAEAYYSARDAMIIVRSGAGIHMFDTATRQGLISIDTDDLMKNDRVAELLRWSEEFETGLEIDIVDIDSSTSHAFCSLGPLVINLSMHSGKIHDVLLGLPDMSSCVMSGVQGLPESIYRQLRLFQYL